mmetsp:Transcript_8137/g.12902  ORF Transcript_8137/g.12902 Transcript_8137/m.12902 type:complete len:131 (-) Transcript_8137:1956-2348(-)
MRRKTSTYIQSRNNYSSKKIVSFWKLRKKAIFVDMVEMMLGFGDCDHPLRSSALYMENLALLYINKLMESVTQLAKIRNSKRPKICDLIFHVRNQKKQKEKVDYLIRMKSEIETTVGPGKNVFFNIKEMK